MDALAGEAARGAGAVLLTARTLTPAALRALRAVLDGQPHWSDLPVVLLVGGGGDVEAEALFGSDNVTVLDQPARPSTLVSAVRAALRARVRQYEVRDFHATLEDRVAERTAEVRRLAARLTVAEQSERQRIAHVLHDDLQPQLYGLSMVLSLLQRAPSGEEAAALAARATGILDDAVQMARTLAAELSPAVLQSDRLADVLDWVAGDQARYGLAVTVDVRGDPRVADPALRVLLYQSVRELLFNVVKHAGGAAVRLVGEAEGECALVRVEDDGPGFDAEAVGARPAGFGLSSVQERLDLVGGRFEIESAPGQGTRVTLEVPSGGGRPAPERLEGPEGPLPP
jgi:signal transduction histidine kinase